MTKSDKKIEKKKVVMVGTVKRILIIGGIAAGTSVVLIQAKRSFFIAAPDTGHILI